MSDKQTSCPTCSTTYKVTVTQLTVAQGMVCCPRCSTSFNALMHLIQQTEHEVEHTTSHQSSTSHLPNVQSVSETTSTYTHMDYRQPLEIFNRKVENSNIDLKTYLNNLNYFSTDPIGQLPAVNWNENIEAAPRRSKLYYATWIVINLCFILLLTFQFFWFNPHHLKNNAFMSSAFNAICEKVSCSHLSEHYDLITTNKVKVRSISTGASRFTGELINHHDRSLVTPRLHVTLKKQGQVTASYTLNPNEYLLESYVSIQRIPKNSPFKFEFTIPVPKKDFDSYDLEAIRP